MHVLIFLFRRVCVYGSFSYTLCAIQSLLDDIEYIYFCVNITIIPWLEILQVAVEYIFLNKKLRRVTLMYTTILKLVCLNRF